MFTPKAYPGEVSRGQLGDRTVDKGARTPFVQFPLRCAELAKPVVMADVEVTLSANELSPVLTLRHRALGWRTPEVRPCKTERDVAFNAHGKKEFVRRVYPPFIDGFLFVYHDFLWFFFL